MLPKFYREYDRAYLPRIQKTVSGEDASVLGAFSFGTVITWTVRLPRRLGAAAVVVRFWRDGEEPRDVPLTFVDTHLGEDVYEWSLDTKDVCQGQDFGLFYYYFLLVRGPNTLFTDSVNNVDFTLSERAARPFRLLVHAPDFKTPSWFRGGTMYHIFVDRFCRGEGYAPLRKGATLETDWQNGIPQFAPYPGAPLANDRFFGGNLWGIIEKLDYLKSLGVTVLYLSPIFEAASNHKYDTGDYERVDAAFGGEEAFTALISQAKARGIRIVLDGVFNHTGDDSRYFNRYGHYSTLGAYQSPDSPYADWYSFERFPDKYECWWGIDILPRIASHLPSVRAYLAGPDGIAATRLRQGVAGWRLDVADELSDEFLDDLRTSLHAVGEEQPLIIGEVWENAVEKMAYGRRRRYFAGQQLDSVMNYPVRNAIIAFVRDKDASALYHTLTELYGSYPLCVSHSLMNLLGTHDTERILTVLADASLGAGKSNAELSVTRLSNDAKAEAIERLKVAFVLLFTVFGVPSVFYGDEAGIEGYRDPFCRRPYPWGREQKELVSLVRFLGQLRASNPALADGEFRVLDKRPHVIAYERRRGQNRLLIVANMGEDSVEYHLSGQWQMLSPDGPCAADRCLSVAPHTALILKEVAT